MSQGPIQRTRIQTIRYQGEGVISFFITFNVRRQIIEQKKINILAFLTKTQHKMLYFSLNMPKINRFCN